MGLLVPCAFVTAMLWFILLDETQTTPVPPLDIKPGTNGLKSEAMTYSTFAMRLLDLILKFYPDDNLPMDCDDILHNGHNESGVYEVWPVNRISKESLKVHCDMKDDGGGWTVIQRRGYNREKRYFLRDWDAYKKGFGFLQSDFWLGNDDIYRLTNQRNYSLKIMVEDRLGRQRYALYDVFWIENEDNKYKIHVKGYNGSAGDSLHNEAPFTTVDSLPYNKNKFSSPHMQECWGKFSGGWWIKTCFDSNLNGLYATDASLPIYTGIVWNTWESRVKPFRATEMKIRQKKF